MQMEMFKHYEPLLEDGDPKDNVEVLLYVEPFEYVKFYFNKVSITEDKQSNGTLTFTYVVTDSNVKMPWKLSITWVKRMMIMNG